MLLIIFFTILVKVNDKGLDPMQQINELVNV